MLPAEKPHLAFRACLSVIFSCSCRSAGAGKTRCRTNMEFAVAEHRCGELELKTLKPRLLGWIRPLQRHVVKEDRQARTAEPNCAFLRVEKQMTCYFLILFSLLMWSINIQPGTHQCHARGLGLLHWVTPHCILYITIWCGHWKDTVSLCFAANFWSL